MERMRRVFGRWGGAAVVAAAWLSACSLETQPYPGWESGTGGGTTTAPSGVECTKETEEEKCSADPLEPCKKGACVGGWCTMIADDAQVPPGGTQCRILSCVGGAVQETLAEPGTMCGAPGAGASCDGQGNCGCEVDADCVLDAACPTWKCEGAPKRCVLISAPEGVPAQVDGDCARLSCESGLSVKTWDQQDAPNENPPDPCTAWKCLGIEDAVKEPLPGKACGAAQSCISVYRKAADACNAEGLCEPGEATPCAPFACDTAAGQCKTTCTPSTQDEDCIDGYCEAGVCKAKIGTGMPCTAGPQCLSGFCVDGVCCNNACDTACNTCTLGGAMPGTCSPLPKGVVDTCNAGQACNGGACVSLGTKKAIGTACTQDFDCFHENANMTNCSNNLCRLDLGAPCEQATFWYCSTKFCDATGVCAACASNADCGPGGQCTPIGAFQRCRLGPGAPCGNDNDCANGLTCNLASGSPGTCQ